MDAYLSIISTDDYSLGALMLYESLKLTNTKFPFYLIITQEVSYACEIKLIKYGLNVIRDNEILLTYDVDNNMIEKRWNYSFDKLKIFKLEQFSKIVYLDSDMFVVNNIDSLFSFSHLSAVPTRSILKWLNNKKYFNSGLMVIEPSKNNYKKILNHLDSTIYEFAKRNQSLGDQDVLHHCFFDWPNKKEQHLPDGYNVFWGSIDLYLRQDNYSFSYNIKKNLIYVIHFTGAHKPWMKSNLFIIKSIIRPIKNLHSLPLVNVLKFIIDYKIKKSKIVNKLSKF